MRKNFMILVIIVCVVLALLAAGAYAIFMPHYKEIQMSGYTLEVPDSNTQVKTNSANYNTYTDTEHDLNIKTWACKDANDTNGTLNASNDFQNQLKENMGTNTTYNNMNIQNKSGTYTYYQVDTDNNCMIIITTKNLDTIEHTVETMKKPEINVTDNPFNLTPTGLNISNPDDNTTPDTQTTTKKSGGTKKKTSSDTIHVSGDPEATGEYKGVGEGIYRNKKTGKVYVEHGRGNLVRTPELDHYDGLAE